MAKHLVSLAPCLPLCSTVKVRKRQRQRRRQVIRERRQVVWCHRADLLTRYLEAHRTQAEVAEDTLPTATNPVESRGFGKGMAGLRVNRPILRIDYQCQAASFFE